MSRTTISVTSCSVGSTYLLMAVLTSSKEFPRLRAPPKQTWASGSKVFSEARIPRRHEEGGFRLSAPFFSAQHRRHPHLVGLFIRSQRHVVHHLDHTTVRLQCLAVEATLGQGAEKAGDFWW